MPSRTFRLNKLREYTCPQCRRTYEKRNSLNRHIRSKHATKLQCFFCDKKFGADRNSRRATHMLRAHDYPVPERFLRGPLDASMDLDSFQRENSIASFDDCVAPVSTPSQMDLASLFPMEEPDLAGIPSVHLPSSPLPSRCSTPVLDERPPPVSQTSETEVRDSLSEGPTLTSSVEVEELLSAFEAHAPSLSGNEPYGSTSGVASTKPLSPPIDTPQMALTPAVSDPETQAAVASIMPEVEVGSSTFPLSASVPDDSLESSSVRKNPEVDFWAEPLGPAVQPDPIAPSPDPSDPTDPHFFFHGAPSQWDDSPTGRLLQEAREQAMAGIQNGYRVEFSARRCIQVTKTEMLTLPDGREYSLISTWLTESSSQ